MTPKTILLKENGSDSNFLFMVNSSIVLLSYQVYRNQVKNTAKIGKMHAHMQPNFFIKMKNSDISDAKILQNFHATCKIFKNVPCNWQILSENVFHIFLYITSLQQWSTSYLWLLQKQSEVGTKYVLQKDFNYGLYVHTRLGYASLKPATFYISFFSDIFAFA